VLSACGAGATNADDVAEEAPPCPDCDVVDASADAWFDGRAQDAAPDAAAVPPATSPLCGSGCDPDWTAACADDAAARAPAEGGDEAGDGGGLPYPGDAEADEAPPGAPAAACHVIRGDGGPVATCEPAGAGETGDACDSSRDCAPGLGCVGTVASAKCRPWCCGDPEGCPAGAYCAPRHLRDDAASVPPIQVPACVPADRCQLLDPLACDAGRVCAIVRSDGTTACVEPGPGLVGDPCPCAGGFVCAKTTNRCLRLCHTGAAGECPDGTCQGGSAGFPPGFGVCVGGT
jgi:hypothetical protein